MAKNTKKKTVRSNTVPMEEWMQLATLGYMALLFVVYPLYFRNKYFDMGEAKFIFFRNITCIYAIMIAFLFAVKCIELIVEKSVKAYLSGVIKQLNLADKFVLGYLGVCVIATIFAPDKELALTGYPGWNMGLLSQIAFVFLYFSFSRLWKSNKYIIGAGAISAACVFLLGVIMRLGWDPLHMYTELAEMYPDTLGVYVVAYLSTLGQASWYSSYVVLVFAIGLFFYWHCEKIWVRLLMGMFVLMGSMTIVSQNTDSAYLALGVVLFALFWISMESNSRFLRFLESLILCLAGFKAMGLLQIVRGDKAVVLDSLSMMLSKGNLTWVLLGCTCGCYGILFVLFRKTGLEISKIKNLRVILLAVGLVVILGTVIYIGLNTAELLPVEYLSDNNYLYFDENWGNSRGLSWMCAVGAYIRYNIFYKLIGVGPDCFSAGVYMYFGEELTNRWGEDLVLACAHNEWLNQLLTAGLVGAALYIGIFVSVAKDCAKKAKEQGVVYAVVLCILAYMAHNVFCYQQVICTPIVFVVMGIGEAMCREKKD